MKRFLFLMIVTGAMLIPAGSPVAADPIEVVVGPTTCDAFGGVIPGQWDSPSSTCELVTDWSFVDLDLVIPSGVTLRSNTYGVDMSGATWVNDGVVEIDFFGLQRGVVENNGSWTSGTAGIGGNSVPAIFNNYGFHNAILNLDVGNAGIFLNKCGSVFEEPFIGVFVGGDGQFVNESCDTDGDGVVDVDDVCANTDLDNDPAPDRHKKNRLWSDATGGFFFGNGDPSGITVIDTGGCSASQIIEAAGLGKGHAKFGISRSAMEAFIASLNAP